MLPIDTLVSIGLATVSLGTINEADGRQECDFWLRNAGTEPVTLVQGYTSCGCVKLTFPLGESIQPGDSLRTVLGFDPKGKGGEFYERGTIVYGKSRKRIDLVMEGTCVTSEETLMKQYPVKVCNNLRLSANHFDLGMMKPGETKTRTVVILHQDEENRQEQITVNVTAPLSLTKGIHHIKKQIQTVYKNQSITVDIDFDLKII